ncbi:hypothetical protein FO440_15215 [Mucilaginibacter corticis]|uniref:Uncharacterized protein n=1 Tax=Mucilaginibacter corticis TaxID=2597670 RepID=A0A556MMB6_9SPHI|nr:hypothetical protein [Mucilaginibacter corticis]TSJ41076.1 hypothetical protein FO440_15215 [Mucilaginibacter corticis]
MMINTPLPDLIDKLNKKLTDGNQAILHQDAIRFLIDESQNKMMKLLEFMDLIEELTGQSANDYYFDVEYRGE